MILSRPESIKSLSKRRFFPLLRGLLGVAVFVSGCSTTVLIKPDLEDLMPDFGDLMPDFEDLAPDFEGLVPDLGNLVPDFGNLVGDKPQTFLAGAEVQQAKSLAMGSAVTKGWKIIDASDNRFLIGRPLNIATAGRIAGEPVTAPWVEVRTDFNARRAGVDVVAGAALIADKITEKGEKSAIRIDVT